MAFYETDNRCDKYDIYDNVWVMFNNMTVERLVYSKTHTMNLGKNGVDTTYKLVESTVGVDHGGNMSIQYNSRFIFKTKEELIASL